MDQRILGLLLVKENQCCVRKLPVTLRIWLNEMIDYSRDLYNRPDREDQPNRNLRNQLFTLIKFVTIPNNNERKTDLMKTDWEPLKSQIVTFLGS